MKFLTERDILDSMENRFDVAIIGGGIAGYTAALALKNFGENFFWLAAAPFGGKLLLAGNVRNFPAFNGSGKELFALLEAQRMREGIDFIKGRADGIFAAENGFTVTAGERSYIARTVILAVGTETQKIAGEEKFLGRGVGYCAVCDGALYKNKKIAAVLETSDFEEEAEYLAGFAAEVYAFPLYQGASFRAKNIRKIEEIPLAVSGDTRVNALKTKEREYAVDGVFLLKTATPPASLAGGLETENGHVKTARDMSTNIGGLFAAGDVTGTPYQYVKAAGEGLTAAYSAHAYLLQMRKTERSKL